MGFTHIAPCSLPAIVPLPRHAQAPRLFDSDDLPTLRPTLDAVQQHASDGSLVILDGLAEVLTMGFTPLDLHRFVRAAYAHTNKVSLRNQSLVAHGVRR